LRSSADVILRDLWRRWVRTDELERDLDDEVRAYVNQLAAQYERRASRRPRPDDAQSVGVGGVEQVKERRRDAWPSLGRCATVAVRELVPDSAGCH